MAAVACSGVCSPALGPLRAGRCHRHQGSFPRLSQTRTSVSNRQHLLCLCSRQGALGSSCTQEAPAQPACSPHDAPAGQSRAALPQQHLAEAVGFLALAALAGCPAASAAAEAVGYNPEGGSETLKTLAGVGYIVLVVVYFFRLFRKRAQNATSQPLASTLSSKDGEEDSDDEEEALPQPPPKATPLAAFIGAAQAGVICYLLFLLTQAVDGYFASKALPEQYTARNIAVLVQTVVRGLAYLLTFIFGANAVGLTGLTLQLLLFPELDDDAAPARRQEAAQKLPDVSVTDDIFAIRRAFQEAERMGSKSSVDVEGK